MTPYLPIFEDPPQPTTDEHRTTRMHSSVSVVKAWLMVVTCSSPTTDSALRQFPFNYSHVYVTLPVSEWNVNVSLCRDTQFSKEVAKRQGGSFNIGACFFDFAELREN